MSIEEVSPEQLAKLFHHYQQVLAHKGDARNGAEGCYFWDHAPQNDRKTMVAAARLALLELSTTPAPPSRSRKYYAEPGEAEWGC